MPTLQMRQLKRMSLNQNFLTVLTRIQLHSSAYCRAVAPGRDGSRVKAVALFDSGADRSYISASLARKIQSQVIGIYSLTAKGTETGSANLTCVEIPNKRYVHPCCDPPYHPICYTISVS